MSTSTRTKFVHATSQDVRAYFTANPDKVPAGAEVSVQKSCKGRIKPNAIAVFNADKSHGMKYIEGTERHMPLPYVAGNHREVTVSLPVKTVRAMAGKEGSRGPLSQTDLDFAAEVYASTVAKSKAKK